MLHLYFPFESYQNTKQTTSNQWIVPITVKPSFLTISALNEIIVLEQFQVKFPGEYKTSYSNKSTDDYIALTSKLTAQVGIFVLIFS